MADTLSDNLRLTKIQPGRKGWAAAMNDNIDRLGKLFCIDNDGKFWIVQNAKYDPDTDTWSQPDTSKASIGLVLNTDGVVSILQCPPGVSFVWQEAITNSIISPDRGYLPPISSEDTVFTPGTLESGNLTIETRVDIEPLGVLGPGYTNGDYANLFDGSNSTYVYGNGSGTVVQWDLGTVAPRLIYAYFYTCGGSRERPESLDISDDGSTWQSIAGGPMSDYEEHIFRHIRFTTTFGDQSGSCYYQIDVRKAPEIFVLGSISLVRGIKLHCPDATQITTINIHYSEDNENYKFDRSYDLAQGWNYITLSDLRFCKYIKIDVDFDNLDFLLIDDFEIACTTFHDFVCLHGHSP